jgi:hypothetical protein
MVTFPIDFFEHCQAMNEVEFGGNDLLQIYNTQQIKHRLNTTGNVTYCGVLKLFCTAEAFRDVLCKYVSKFYER